MDLIFTLFKMLLVYGLILTLLIAYFSLLIRFLFFPLFTLFSIPTYASLISIECLVCSYNKRKYCPKLLKLHLPKTFKKKLYMNGLASFCAMYGIVFTRQLFMHSPNSSNAEANLNNFIKIIVSNQNNEFLTVLIFFSSLIGTMCMSYFMKDDEKDPVNKLESLVIPDWAKKIFSKC